MINVYIVSGFLGAGKTTFIQKLLAEKKFEKVMLLENEFGEVGVDGAFFDSSLNIKEINNGCICCSLQGDFEQALEEIEDMGITDLLIEPSGVGKLSEIINVIKHDDDYRIVSHICIVDVKTSRKYHLNFKEYFDDQVKSANAVILSHTDVADEETIHGARDIVEELNEGVTIVEKPIGDVPVEELLDVIVAGGDILPDFDDDDHHDHDHHHHHEHECCEGEECECHHDHDHEHDHEHEHHHDHDHHHHHHDDETFKNLILNPEHRFTKEELEKILSDIPEDIIRIKGYVLGNDETLYFNYVLNEYDIFTGADRDSSLVSIIGTEIDEELFRELFNA
ncbi:MAG: GTP-binding protein [Erysipelotrichaceae bacterium]|nr:GTP-binding protein [Erysipelotrichaceae bacterium]